ncbi:uncharacterized protein N0V89_004246 [Didymosphaeria variabile]|uniref:Uncharacterized protein n=1 Tax=Didymosphaeria variabile TaxID=1932322 RepID=A0A9W9CDE7_9PLEO|nr:uncharacterized protein N0V89_004246 [Didymosphaeria variabile]KAJ4356216.1 hypothetical protein N0V89_004246 [Didymosphaeria variabile]
MRTWHGMMAPEQSSFYKKVKQTKRAEWLYSAMSTIHGKEVLQEFTYPQGYKQTVGVTISKPLESLHGAVLQFAKDKA